MYIPYVINSLFKAITETLHIPQNYKVPHIFHSGFFVTYKSSGPKSTENQENESK